jgi:hypothetical protein
MICKFIELLYWTDTFRSLDVKKQLHFPAILL